MGDEDELNVDLTPLIDVIFMLVIFFIMTMSFNLPVLEFSLPQSKTAQLEDQSETIRVSIKEDGTILVQDEVTTLEALSAQLKAQAEAGKQLALELVIDKKADAQHLITMADLARLYTQGRLLVVAEVSASHL